MRLQLIIPSSFIHCSLCLSHRYLVLPKISVQSHFATLPQEHRLRGCNPSFLELSKYFCLREDSTSRILSRYSISSGVITFSSLALLIQEPRL